MVSVTSMTPPSVFAHLEFRVWRQYANKHWFENKKNLAPWCSRESHLVMHLSGIKYTRRKAGGFFETAFHHAFSPLLLTYDILFSNHLGTRISIKIKWLEGTEVRGTKASVFARESACVAISEAGRCVIGEAVSAKASYHDPRLSSSSMWLSRHWKKGRERSRKRRTRMASANGTCPCNEEEDVPMTNGNQAKLPSKISVVLGAQWGDEGKGQCTRFIDFVYIMNAIFF